MEFKYANNSLSLNGARVLGYEKSGSKNRAASGSPKTVNVKVQPDGTVTYRNKTYKNLEEFKKSFPNSKVKITNMNIPRNNALVPISHYQPTNSFKIDRTALFRSLNLQAETPFRNLQILPFANSNVADLKPFDSPLKGSTSNLPVLSSHYDATEPFISLKNIASGNKQTFEIKQEQLLENIKPNPQNPLLQSIKPNQDFRGKNLIGEQLTEAQKILRDKTVKIPMAPLQDGKLYGEILDEIGHGAPRKVNQELADRYKDIMKSAENSNAKATSKLAKFGKWGAAIAGVAALGVGAWALLKSDNNDEAKKSQADNPLNKKPQIKTQEPKKEDAPKTTAPADSTKTEKSDSASTAKSDSTEIVKPAVVPSDSTEVEKTEAEKTENGEKITEAEQAQTTQESGQVQYIPLLQLDDDGSYTTKYGDSFWRIAKKHLQDKFKEQGIDREPTIAEIQKETDRIMNANEYGYDENHWFSNPMLHPNVKLIIEQKLDKAA